MTFLKSLPDDMRILLILAAFWLPVMLLCGVYAFRDARRCGRNPVLWSLVSALVPGLVGFIAYLITRDPQSALACPECGIPVSVHDDTCPKCAVRLRASCPGCGGRLEPEWRNCPHCGAMADGICEILPPVAHTGKMLRSILIAVILIPALLMGSIAGVMAFTRGNCLFLTRHQTDGTLADGFLDLTWYDTDEWYCFTRTNADGSTVTVEQYFGNFQITRVTPEGETETRVWDLSYGGMIYASGMEADHFAENEGPYGSEGRTEGSYCYNEEGRLYLHELQSSPPGGGKTQIRFNTVLSYDADGRIIRQKQQDIRGDEFSVKTDLSPEEAKLRYETYSYDAYGRLSRGERYNFRDELQGYTEYLWSLEDTVRIARSYTPEGTLTESSVSTFDDGGELLRQEHFDADGNLVYSVEFGNDVTAFLLLDYTTILLTFLWGVVMVITILMLLPEKKK